MRQKWEGETEVGGWKREGGTERKVKRGKRMKR